MSLEQSLIDDYEAIFVLDDWSLGTNGCTVSASSEQATGSLGVENLLSPALDTAWRSGGWQVARPTSSIISVIFALGQPRVVDWVSLHRHNVRVPWRVSYHRGSPGSSPAVYQSGWHDPIVRASLSDFTYRDLRYTLGPETDDLELWESQFRLDSFIRAPTPFYGIRYVRIEFDIAEATDFLQSTDYLHVGKALIARSFQPRINVLLDWEMGYEDRSEVHRVESGALLGRRRQGGRTLALVLGYLDHDEAFERLLTGYIRKHGKLGRVFVWVEPTQRRYFYDQAMTATATTLPKIAMANLNWPAAKGWQLEETE